MDLDGVPDINNSVNYEEVGALSQKRIIAFFNEFVGKTVAFLNNFSSECEEKLFVVDTRIDKLETMLSILEAKLSSVPGLTPSQNSSHDMTNNGESANLDGTSRPDNSATAASVSQSVPTPHANDQSASSLSNGDQSASSQPNDDQSEAGLVRLRQTEPYRRYFRMLEVGVPEPAVRIKMQQDGVDPDGLQRGGELVQDPAAAVEQHGSESDESDAAHWESESS